MADEEVWHDEEHRRSAFHEAAHAVICFVLYGEEVVRDVSLASAVDGPGGVSTFSKLPIPMVCRPSGGEPRRGNPAPVSSDAIVDAHGVLQYAGSVAEALLVSWEAKFDHLSNESALERAQADRVALSEVSKLVGRDRTSETFYAEYWEEAARLLRANWAGVVVLAETLGRHGRISGTRSDQVLRASQIGD
jgi:hypothetical protein